MASQRHMDRAVAMLYTQAHQRAVHNDLSSLPGIPAAMTLQHRDAGGPGDGEKSASHQTVKATPPA